MKEQQLLLLQQADPDGDVMLVIAVHAQIDPSRLTAQCMQSVLQRHHAESLHCQHLRHMVLPESTKPAALSGSAPVKHHSSLFHRRGSPFLTRIVGMACAAESQCMKGRTAASSTAQKANSSCLLRVMMAKLSTQMAGCTAAAMASRISPAAGISHPVWVWP